MAAYTCDEFIPGRPNGQSWSTPVFFSAAVAITLPQNATGIDDYRDGTVSVVQGWQHRQRA
jgi:hypothetical protein